ncbi:hypothetical protein [uncultured Prevotella sp.]|uniref:HU family DNA-binding protein n=1 Tax=uncultured Prevotella sp. TaxID=159272 RepID=UPI00259AD161|nr:hypothetical protein [uncultured Prevotella sp.]
MAIKTRIAVRENHLTKEKVASANIVDLQPMSFTEFCDYMAQDSTVGVADVMAVMTQLEKKLPLLLALGTKVQVSAEGMIVRPTVSGSLTQSQLKAKLEARKAAGEDVDVNREITAADLTVKDLTAGVAIDFSKKFNAAFAQNGTFKRVGDAATDATTSPDASGGTSGGDQKPPSEVEG